MQLSFIDIRMENSKVISVGALVLLVGLALGFLGGKAASPAAMPANMHQTMGAMNLQGKTGDALDMAFLDEMILHHEGAVEMAKVLLQGTKRPELIELGNNILTAQTKEIEMMKQWKADWF